MVFGDRRAVVCAAALTLLVTFSGISWLAGRASAATEDREPRIDESFGRGATARRANDLASKAIEFAGNGDYASARITAKESDDPVAIKLVEWLYLRDTAEKAGYQRIMAFITANPSWPSNSLLLQDAERALYANRESPSTVAAHFANRLPQTPEGMLALARSSLASGDKQLAHVWAARAWRIAEADPDVEKQISDEFGSLLNDADNKARLWTKIIDQETNAALRVSRRLAKDYQLAASAAQLLIRGYSGANKANAALSPTMRSEPGMQYALARYYRKANKFVDAASVLLKMPVDHGKLYDADPIWTERRIVARELLTRSLKKYWPMAYKLAASHGFDGGPNAVEGEFLAGWIALRYLNQPDTALKHFTKLTTITTTRTDMARAKYWLGRTYAANGNADLASASFKDAAKMPTVFYGALARDALGQGKIPIDVTVVSPAADSRARVAKDELVQAFRILARAGREGEMGLFLWPIAQRLKTAEDMSAAASVVSDDGGPFMAVRLAKAAASYGIDIDQWGYPIRAMPSWKQLGPGVEKAFVYGLVRQESEFNAQAGSQAGAQGLMQLMPGTARLITKQYKVPFKPAQLISDPSYNARLGSAHLGDLVAEFRGSYILTLVAYNAGPGRSLEWMQRYGDPRAKGVDPIDWVESIPFTETRHYVQKVLQNTHVYRSRLDPDTMRGMTADLLRGSAKKNIDYASAERRGIHSCAVSAANMAALIAECD